MMSVPLKPSKEWHSNCEATLPGTKPLPMTYTKSADGADTLVTVWRCDWWTRIRFLFDGRINLLVLSKEQHPPVMITLGEEIHKL